MLERVEKKKEGYISTLRAMTISWEREGHGGTGPDDAGQRCCARARG